MATGPASADDYVFRYRLRLATGEAEAGGDRATRLLGELLAGLLDVVVPVNGDREVAIDGFRLLRDREATFSLPLGEADSGAESPDGPGFQIARNAALYEPRIDLIRRQLERLLALVELEKDGRPVAVDGFRLRDLTDWLVPSLIDPVAVIAAAGSRCDLDCVFCYNKGNPPSLALHSPERSSAEELHEMATRLRYFSPEARRSLFPSLGSTYEVLLQPGVIEVLRELRQKSQRVFRIATHGGLLTPEMVASLAALRPVYLYLSLNSASPARRRRLMADRHPETAIAALPLLREAGIPFATVIVPWPLDSIDEMLDDLVATVACAAGYDSHIIQLNLPGRSGYLAPEKPYDREEVWSAVVDRVGELRETVSTPIVVMPGLYEENRCQSRKGLATVTGVVGNSPAAAAGIESGDEIASVGGLVVSGRSQARALLQAHRDGGAGPVTLSLRRRGGVFEAQLDPAAGSYPYSAIDRYFGLVIIASGFRSDYVETLREIVDRRGAKKVLLLSSELVRPSLEQALSESPLFTAGGALEIVVPRNGYFGGDIFMGDLLVVQDFIDAIAEYREGGGRPDLVVIPSSPFALGGWQRDLTGRVYLDIERATGLPVELVDCDTVYD